MTEYIKTASVKELLNLMDSKVPTGYVEVSADKLQNIEGLNDPRIDFKAYFNAQTHDVILTGTNKPQPLGGKADAGRRRWSSGFDRSRRHHCDGRHVKAQADAQEASNRQTYSLLTLNLVGNGISRKAQQASGMSPEDVQADTTKGMTRLNVDNCSLRQTIPCIRYEWMRLRKSSASACKGSWRQHGGTYTTQPRQQKQQAYLLGYRAELPQSEADIRAFDAAVRQLIAPTAQLLMDDIHGV